jgi:hypothetical protein
VENFILELDGYNVSYYEKGDKPEEVSSEIIRWVNNQEKS